MYETLVKIRLLINLFSDFDKGISPLSTLSKHIHLDLAAQKYEIRIYTINNNIDITITYKSEQMHKG